MKRGILVFVSILAVAAISVLGLERTNVQATNEQKLSITEKFQTLMATPPAYRVEALSLVVAEANRVAEQLHLPEKLPITRENLLAAYVSPPSMSQYIGAIGNITTSNYVYYVSVGRKFSFLTRTHLAEEYAQLKSQYLWPVGRMDTNAAYAVATQLLAAVSMDVKALNRDCGVRIAAFTPEGKTGAHFVPVYWVDWVKGNGGEGSVASIELLLPTKTVRQLHVTESEYILRRPLEILDLDKLLSQTNTPATR
ncbi:MAG: hypothetical protein HY298_23715 [Verrucomicrobia bacterium]|nr:hypothetical protein [Verrucomicrobiota bacterium]